MRTGFALVGGPARQDAPKAIEALTKLNVPYLVSLPLVFQTTEEWLDSELGVHPVQVALQVTPPPPTPLPPNLHPLHTALRFLWRLSCHHSLCGGAQQEFGIARHWHLDTDTCASNRGPMRGCF